MKKCIFLLLFISSTLFAQSITQEEIIGSWKAIEAEGLDKLPPKQAKMMENMFLDAAFKFQENGRFDIVLKNTKGIAQQEFLKTIKNSRWIFNSDKSTISIGNKSNNFKIMEIYVAEKETQIYFLLKESPLILKVVKESWN